MRATLAALLVLGLTTMLLPSSASDPNPVLCGGQIEGNGMADGLYGWSGQTYEFKVAENTEATWTWSDGLQQNGKTVSRSFDDDATYTVTANTEHCTYHATFDTDIRPSMLDDGTYQQGEGCIWLFETPRIAGTPSLIIEGNSCEWFYLMQSTMPSTTDHKWRGRVLANDLIAYESTGHKLDPVPSQLDVPPGHYTLTMCFDRTDDIHDIQFCRVWGEAWVVNT